MTYRKKFIILSSLIGCLLLVYILGTIFSPERMLMRNAAYCWLESKAAENARKIVLKNNDETITLVKKSNAWFVLENDILYPAKQMRVEDLFSALTSRGTYAIRTNSASSHAGFGLNEENAARITVFDNLNMPLLDLLIGLPDIIGQNVFLRKFNSNEVRSGDRKILTYTSGTNAAWYNYRFIPEIDDTKLNSANVQRLTVFPPALDGISTEPQIFSKKGRGWTFNKTDDARLDKSSVDAYIQSLLFAEGNGFSEEIESTDPILDYRKIKIEFGTGLIKEIKISNVTEDKYYAATGTDFVYTLSSWMAERLFHDDEYFIKSAD